MLAFHLSCVSLGARLGMHKWQWPACLSTRPEWRSSSINKGVLLGALFCKSRNYLDTWNSSLFITVPWHSFWEHPENLSTDQIHYEDLMWPDGENAEIAWVFHPSFLPYEWRDWILRNYDCINSEIGKCSLKSTGSSSFSEGNRHILQLFRKKNTEPRDLWGLGELLSFYFLLPF